MAEHRATLAVYGRLVGARIRSDWQYRTSFALYLVGQATVAIMDVATIGVIFGAVDELAGWSVAEVALLYGFSGLAFALADLLASPVEHVADHIKAGTFDRFLIRPVDALVQLLAAEFALRRVGRTLLPGVVLLVALGLADVSWTPAKVALVPLTVVSGTAIFGALWVATSSVAFWTVETQELANVVTYGGDQLTSYPVEVYGRWLRRVVVFVVPFASVAYLPAAWLLDKPVAFGLPAAACWSGPIVAVVAVVVARGVWRTAVRHYRSTGS